MTAALAAPFPYFGGKRRAAPLVWDAIGADVAHYVEPFAGSIAVLLQRPRPPRLETVNDADGRLVNTWRAIRLHPHEVAAELDGWPVTEIDYHARLAHLDRNPPDIPALEGDPEHCDPKAAAWWLYVMACGIGNPFEPGPWTVVDGRLVKAGRGVNRELPHLGDSGQGVNRELPHLGDSGQGPIHHYMQALSQRLAKVRITCGDWRRVLTPSVLRAGSGATGIFLDPPYEVSGGLYGAHCGGGAISKDVRDWCAQADPALRIVLAGYDTEHDDLLPHGWTKTKGKSGGGGGGYSSNPLNGRRERLWVSPGCHPERSPGLW